MAHQPLQHMHLVSLSQPLSLGTRNCDAQFAISLPLEMAKTDESGITFHEECYVLKVELRRASGR